MKKLLLLITGLLLLFSLEGQILRYSNYTSPAPPEEEPVEAPAILTSDGYTMGWYMASDSIVKDEANLIRRWGDYTTSIGHDLLQSVSANQPLHVPASGGTTSYVQMAADDNFLTTASFTLTQPVFIYMVMRQDESNGGIILCGEEGNGRLVQTTTPGIRVYAGSAWALLNNDATIDSWVIVRFLLNGASSKIVVNGGTASTGDPGEHQWNQICIGGVGSGVAAMCSYKEIIVRRYSDNSTDENAILNYLNTKYSIY